MSIQSNVNQALGIGAALLSQTGRAEEVKETRALKKGLKTEQRNIDTLGKAFNEATKNATEIIQNAQSPKEADEVIDTAMALMSQRLESAKRAQGYVTRLGQGEKVAELQKAISGTEAAMGIATRLRELANAAYEAERREAANQRAKSVIQNKKAQRDGYERFMRAVAGKEE